MKKVVLTLLALGILGLAFTVPVVEREFTFKLTNSQVGLLYQSLENSKQSVLQSTVPTNQGVTLIKNIDSCESIIKIQYNEQLKDTTKKVEVLKKKK